MKKMRVQLNVLLLTILVVSLSVSCDKVEQDYGTNEIMTDRAETEYIIREANPQNKVVEGDISDDESLRTKGVNGISNYLGKTYKVDVYPLEDIDNIGILSVFNVDKYIHDHPEDYVEDSYNKIENRSRVFTSLENDDSYKNEHDVIEASSSIGIGLIKASIKYRFENTFNEKSSSQHKLAYAEFINLWKHKGYSLDFGSYTKNNSEILNYLSKDFLDRLHNRTPKKFIEQYGPYVLSKYQTGSRATVLYEGEYSFKSNYTVAESKRSFESRINASLGKWSLGAGYSNSEENKDSSSNKNIFTKYKYWTSAFNSVIGPDTAEISHELGNMVFDFTDWYNSLKDTTNFHIVQLPTRALIPLTNYIEESNIRDQFEKYCSGKTIPDKLQTPSIRINTKQVDGGCNVSVILISRYGDNICLVKDKYVESAALNQYLASTCARLIPIFPDLKISSNSDLLNWNSKPGLYVTIEIVYHGRDDINTYVGQIPYSGILIRSVELTRNYTRNYLRLEKERISKLYPKAKIVINDLDDGYSLVDRGLSLDQMSTLKMLVDRTTTDEEIEDFYVNGDIVIPSYYYKYVDSKTGRIYIIDRDTMTAYCLYNQTIVRNYFSDRFIETLPASKIKSLDEIRKHYNIIAL